MPLKIFYIHGWQSCFDKTKPKVRHLAALGEVAGITVDYVNESLSEIKSRMRNRILDFDPDLVIGSSLGGWMAAHIGTEYDMPFVALNPCVNPPQSLGLPEKEYGPFATGGYGLILLDSGDEMFDSYETERQLRGYYECRRFPGGYHQFAHMEESIPLIEKFLSMSIVWGVDNV